MKNWFTRLFPPRNSRTTGRAPTQRLACREIVELVTEYLEGVLPPEQHTQFEEHLAGCPGCRQYLGQVNLTISMLRKLAQEPVFPETKEELVQMFRQWKKR